MSNLTGFYIVVLLMCCGLWGVVVSISEAETVEQKICMEGEWNVERVDRFFVDGVEDSSWWNYPPTKFYVGDGIVVDGSFENTQHFKIDDCTAITLERGVLDRFERVFEGVDSVVIDKWFAVDNEFNIERERIFCTKF